MSKVSVVIPVYNGVPYIDRCISMLSIQTYKELEVIFVDDGSVDESWRKLNDKTNRLDNTVLIHKVNGGVSSARNFGLAKASGEFVVFADVDDLWEPEYIEKLVKGFHDTKTDLVICSYNEITPDGQELFRYDPESCLFTSVEELMQNYLQSHKICSALWNKIFRLDMIRKNDIYFDETMTIGEDMIFLTNYCLHIGQAFLIPDCLYSYVKNPEGAMQKRKKEKQFQKKWLSEWYAVLEVERLVKDYKLSKVPALAVKKVRVADKLLKIMAQFNYQDRELKKNLVKCIREDWRILVSAKDVGKKQKVTTILNAVNPTICELMIRIQERRRGDEA